MENWDGRSHGLLLQVISQMKHLRNASRTDYSTECRHQTEKWISCSRGLLTLSLVFFLTIFEERRNPVTLRLNWSISKHQMSNLFFSLPVCRFGRIVWQQRCAFGQRNWNKSAFFSRKGEQRNWPPKRQYMLWSQMKPKNDHWRIRFLSLKSNGEDFLGTNSTAHRKLDTQLFLQHISTRCNFWGFSKAWPDFCVVRQIAENCKPECDGQP